MNEGKRYDDAVITFVFVFWILYNFTHCDDLFQADSWLLLLCVFYVRDDTVISRNSIGKVFRILYL